MNRLFRSSLVTLAVLALPLVAAAQYPDSKEIQNLSGHANLLFNVKLNKVSLTSVSLVSKKGSALGPSNVGLVDVFGTVVKVNDSKAITLPNQSVFGGTSNDLDVFFYLSSTGLLCLSDANSLLVKGSVVSGNTGFVSCPNGTVASAVALRLLGKAVYDNATQLTSADVLPVQNRGINTF